MTDSAEIAGAELRDISGVPCLILRGDGEVIDSEDAGRDLIGEALAHGASMIVLPVTRLDASFFDLRSGLAGAILQKMVNYRKTLAIIGDISQHVAASDAFRDLVRESGRGRDVIFASDIAVLEERLGTRK